MKAGIKNTAPAAARAAGPRVFTNTDWLDSREIDGRPVAPVKIDPGAPWARKLRYLALWRYDAVFLNIEANWLYLVCAAKKLLPFTRCRILSVDLILTRPRGFWERVRFWLRRWLLREVDRFVLYYRDTTELQRVYSLPAGQIRYVPFKANTLDDLRGIEPTDEGFFLACGRSNRDYSLLCEALRGLPYRCVILAPWGRTEEHGAHFDQASCPPNVELVSDDGSTESWNDWIARARAVVLPILPGMLSPSGIGTYLVAMALGKSVIITEGPATTGILSDETAALVPPGDVEAMRRAIFRVAEDVEFRTALGAAGRRYALSLSGEQRLRDDLVRELAELVAAPADHEARVGWERSAAGSK